MSCYDIDRKEWKFSRDREEKDGRERVSSVIRLVSRPLRRFGASVYFQTPISISAPPCATLYRSTREVRNEKYNYIWGFGEFQRLLFVFYYLEYWLLEIGLKVVFATAKLALMSCEHTALASFVHL